MKKLLVILMTVGLFLGAGIGVASAEVLYGLTFDEQLIAIDSTTGSGTLIGYLDSDMKGFGLAALNGRLYTFDQNADVVRELDSATGHTIDTIDIGIGDIIGEGAIAFRSDGLGFLTGYINGMWSFDITAHSSTYIGTNIFIDGLDFDSKDILYGLSQLTAYLYIIDQVTGATTLVGPTGFTASNRLGGLAFGSDGTLYAVIDNALYTLNKNTGAGTFIGNIGFTHVSGLTALVAYLKVSIDIKPGSYPNCFNINGQGVVPVAILGSATFDVRQIDPYSLLFAGLKLRVKGNNAPQCSFSDVSGNFSNPEGAPDGYLDLVCQFVDDPDLWLPGDSMATLTGNLIDGTPIKGTDTICIVP